MQQRRPSSSLINTEAQLVVLPTSKCRELLLQERPVRNAVTRERLGMDYFRNGHLSFTCSINNDLRGLKLDLNYISVFPSSDCLDRGACLFSYQYENVESCEAIGTRLELRFRRSGTKQPTFIAMQSLETQYIREAIWFLQHGKYLDVSLRERASACFSTPSPVKNRQTSTTSSTAATSRRQNGLAYFEDESAIQQRIAMRCRVMGCQRHSEATAFNRGSEISTSNMLNQNVSSHASRGLSTTRGDSDRLCEEHSRLVESPRSPSKRGAFFTRDRSKSQQLASSLIHSAHYSRMLQYQSPLLKKSGVKKYHLSKSWNVKFVAVFETPVGGFLCYYDKLSHCPGVAETPKERRVIDLSSVICIRPESSATNAPTTFAFDIVTIYRTWTFAATEPDEYEVWLKVLTDAVEKHSSMAPDKRLKFPVKMMTTAQASQFQLTRHESTTLEISSYGVCVCSGYEGETEIYSWYFTEIQKWSVVYQQGEACCLLSCLSATSKHVSGSTDMPATPPYHEFLLQSSEAAAICQAIEFYVGKCMAKLEVLAVGVKEIVNRARRGSGELSTFGGTPELIRFRSEQIMKTSPMPIAETSSEKDRKPDQASQTQYVISAVSLKPIERACTGIDRLTAVNPQEAAPHVSLISASTAPINAFKSCTEPDKPTAALCEVLTSPSAKLRGEIGQQNTEHANSQEESSGERHASTKPRPLGFRISRSLPGTTPASPDLRQPELLFTTKSTSDTETQALAAEDVVQASANANGDQVLKACEDHVSAEVVTPRRYSLEAQSELSTAVSAANAGRSQPLLCNHGEAIKSDNKRATSPVTSDKREDDNVKAEDEDDPMPYLELSASSLRLDIDMTPHSPVPIVDLSPSPVPLLESPLFARPGRFSSSFSDADQGRALCENSGGENDDDEDSGSDRFESFGYLICDVFEASDEIHNELPVTCASASSGEVSQFYNNFGINSEEQTTKRSSSPDDKEIQDCEDIAEKGREVQ